MKEDGGRKGKYIGDKLMEKRDLLNLKS